MEAPKTTEKKLNKYNADPLKTKKSNESFLNQIIFTEAMPQMFDLSRCQLEKQSALPPHQICKGKTVMEPSDNTIKLTNIVDQAIGIFPEEIITEILSRLPVRSLHQFKCVSKFWEALIRDPYFKKKHLNRAKNDPNLQRFVVAKMCLDVDRMYSFYSSSLSSVQLVEDEEKLDLPSSCEPRSCIVLCTCDGLVLLAVLEDHHDPTQLYHLLWNPSTRESIAVPSPKPSRGHCICGMGYDKTSDDYKILAIDFHRSHDEEVSSQVLALKGGSWRASKHPIDIHCVLGFRDTGPDCLAFLHGAFHWLGCYGYHTATIVSFDISSEVYGEIPLQERMCDMVFRRNFTERIENGISVLGGMLCFYSTYNNRREGSVKLWVMKEYGVKESWSVLYAIQHSNFHSVRPKYRYADGEVLLVSRHADRIGYAYRTSKGPFELWPEDTVVRQGIIYTESLISPKLLA